MQRPGDALAILISGGLDSAILLGEALNNRVIVHPLYIRHGLYWEETELRHLRNYLEALQTPALQPLQLLEMPVADLYGEHWSITGRNVPDGDSPDAAVFLPGRNVLLLAKAMLWCHLHGVAGVALATLHSNPFPDATPAFFENFEKTVNFAVGGGVQVLRPYSGLHKTEVMRRGVELPLELTFSCIRPFDGLHCGCCNKCAERRRAFADASMIDRTVYRRGPSCIG
jgi:7-cyano-7-deazaguanine synthase